MRLDDPELVREEYASECGLAGRVAGYRFAEGPDAREVAFAAVAEAKPRRVLEVGCGQGWFSEWVARRLGCDVVAIDQSERMVELTRARGVDARLGDACALEFANGRFDTAVAAWMLYHVHNVELALSELRRVLRPGGRLVAVTNSRDHLRDIAELLGMERPEYSFSAESGEELLRRHFRIVDRRDAHGWIAFPSRAEAQQFVDSSILWGGRQLPQLEGPLRVRRAPTIFVATK